MINISFNNISFDKGVTFKNINTGIISVAVEGHAGFGKKGEDPVCAAVSVLTHTLIASIANMLRILPVVTQKDGYEKVEVELSNLPEDKNGILRHLLNFYCIGIFEIESNYKGTLNINFE
ncbi:ribosomal-processing cysteine protease Prp [Spirochaetota bacterium]